MKKSPYPNISDELWDTLLQTLDKDEEESMSLIANSIFNPDNAPALSWMEIEGRKVAFRWGMRLALSSIIKSDDCVLSTKYLKEEGWIK